ncbi:conserved membrane hypothetical protein [Hyella patelloides LEGE 07179]|uniref:Glycosyltransferase RgtA/B/C/D-like domain-containing protein n=1 Tax=Hyella patelloides LEGE 07179 TaxID=945734 RepID=A0A563VWP7_9CYAN|nr:hypothetical protein [Hyella patelloides]VEP15879.1 conserved membrane hypothetical protein [Hyella patelloides LEGE 07179]
MRVVHKVILVTLLWLIFFNPGSITHIDTERRMQMAHAWWSGKEEGITGDKLVINVNGKNYIPYDLGQSMLMLPGDWLGTNLSKSITSNEYQRQQFTEAFVSFAIFVPLNLLAVLACFRSLILFDYPEKLAGLSSIVWLLGTSVLYYSTIHQQNNQILLFVLVSYQTALLYILKEKKQFAVLSGMALGIAFLIRITNLLHAVSVLVFLVGCITYQQLNKQQSKSIFKSLKSVLLWLGGFIPFVVLERILTYYRYGSWTATSTGLHLQIYSRANTLLEPNSIVQGETKGFSFMSLLTKIELKGLLAPLFSPEKSVFIYDSLLIPCLILLFVCWKFLSPYIKWYLIAGILNFMLHLYIYSWTDEWIEHPEWSARYHVTSVHLFLIPLIPLIIRGATTKINKSTNLSKLIVSWIAKIVVAFALFIQLASTILPSGLEQTQQRLGIGSPLRIAQRISNIFTLIDYNPQSDTQISQVLERSPGFAPDRKLTWEILPFRLKIWLKPNSSLYQLIPILFVVWGLICIMAVITTVWVFSELSH